MGVRKKGDKFEAVLKYSSGSLVLGQWECKNCAIRAVEVASRCLDMCRQTPWHGDCPESIKDADDLGIKSVLEEHFGFELSEAEAIRNYESLINEQVEYSIKKALKSESDRAIKRKQFYQAKKLINVVPIIEVDYPKVPIASVPVSKEAFELPKTSGVYFIWYDDSIVYVGQSINLRQRANLFHEKIFNDDRVSWLEFPLFVLNYAEAYYIGVTCPSRNFGMRQANLEERQEVSELNSQIKESQGCSLQTRS